MNVAFGDIFSQGQFSVYVTNISEEGVLIQGNNLWVPKEGASGDGLQYENLASSLGVELGGWSFGVLIVRRLEQRRHSGFVPDQRLRVGGEGHELLVRVLDDRRRPTTSSIISDARNWPPMEGRSLSGYQQKKIWLNDGSGHFNEVAQAVGYNDTHDGRGVEALVDRWNRGMLDVLVATQRGPLLIYKSSVPPENAWVDFELSEKPLS